MTKSVTSYRTSHANNVISRRNDRHVFDVLYLGLGSVPTQSSASGQYHCALIDVPSAAGQSSAPPWVSVLRYFILLKSFCFSYAYYMQQ